jgi:signal transduction histidine kinase
LISGFGVIMVGIVMLGVMLHWFTYRYKIEQKQNELSEISYNILGFLEFRDGTFTIVDDPDIRGKAKQMVSQYGLQDIGGNVRFAYVIDVSTEQIVWNAYDLAAPPDNSSDQFLYFNLDSRKTNFEPFFSQQKPNPPRHKGKLKEGEPSYSTYNQEYLLSAQNFFMQPYGKYQFIVGVSMADVDKDMRAMRRSIAILLFFSAVLVLIAQLALSFWVVAPIKEFEEEVKSIESGEKESVTDPYPEELVPVQNALNALLSYEKGQKQRYKDSLDDLAHSLKTPLAAMQNQLDQLNRIDQHPPPVKTGLLVFASQIDRMHEIIAHQLRRAMVTNQGAMLMSKPVRPVLFRLRDTLQKVYRDKPFEFRINVDEYAKCHMDAEDMMELFGNLLNNACRFCKDLVEVSAHHENNMLIIDIDDDGMGFPSDNPAKLLQRGIREDSKSEGQGIGLAVSTEIISAIGGKIELLVSPYVGARVRLHLPL